MIKNVRQIKQLRAEKERINEGFKQEKIASAKCVESNDDFDASEVHVAKLEVGPLYVCDSLKPVKRKEKLNSTSNKSYSFDITKADQVFDVLLRDINNLS